MRRRIGRRLAGSLAALLLGVSVVGSALAGGGPGPGPQYITFTPGGFALTRQGEVVVTGTVDCALQGTATVSAGVQQVEGKIVSDNPYDVQYHGLLVTGSNGVEVDCPAPGSHDVALTIAADQQRGFRPATARVALDFQYLAHDPATGLDYPGDQFGFIDVELQPGG